MDETESEPELYDDVERERLRPAFSVSIVCSFAFAALSTGL